MSSHHIMHSIIMNRLLIILVTLLIALHSCKTKTVTTQNSTIEDKKVEFKLGIDVLEQFDFAFLEGKRVGLITNPTGVDSRLNSTIDILYNHKNVNLVALFGPEHGVRGNFTAGDVVDNAIDLKTGIPIFSLYGKNKKPNKEAMDLVDILVYDIQDIGVRSYTYISTMGLVMETASDFDKEVLILDRPNPLGGNRIEGPLVDDKFHSFVSKYEIPYIYGLTCGELALMLNNEGLLSDGKKCNLQVVKMEGWKRDMTYNETGLQWIPSSPHIPTWETAFYYASTGIIGEMDPNLIGIGYTLPFKTLVTDNIDADALVSSMNNLNLPGVVFRPIYFKPYYKDKAGLELQGVQIHITDFNSVNLTKIQFVFLQEAHKLDPTFDIFRGNEKKYRMFDLACGSDIFRLSLMKNYDFESIKSQWNKDVEPFRTMSESYYLYEK